jgi:hypothetical protein
MIHGVIAAAVLMAATSPAPAFLGFDARGCAVRYVAMRNLFSYAVDNPEALKSSKTFEQLSAKRGGGPCGAWWRGRRRVCPERPEFRRGPPAFALPPPPLSERSPSPLRGEDCR